MTHIPHAHTTPQDGCPDCLISPTRSRSELIAWSVAGVAVLLLIAVFFLGVGSNASTWIAAGGFGFLGLLLCPIVMGGMMWMMMKKGH